MKRFAVGGLSLGAAAFAALLVAEGFREDAYIPVPGDVPTIGYGSTTHEDGRPVQLGETITREEAERLARSQLATKYEGPVKKCVHVPLYQHEYDAYIHFAYNVGARAFCTSTMVAKLNAGDYAGACAQFDRWTRFKGKDCRIRSNKCYGLVTRRAHERAMCEGR